ncbi:MAG: organomercurial lyase [Marmoricola sp.]
MNTEDLRLAVYRSFADGMTPTLVSLAAELRTLQDTVRAGLFTLANQRHVVLGRDSSIVMAHPFSAVPLGFSVMGREHLWWGGCAWDSFALPHLLPEQAPVLVATRCPACATPHVFDVGTAGPPPGDQVAHFLVPTARMWDDVVHTCSNQRIFCSPDCVEAWLDGRPAGAVLDLSTLWNLASHWYDGRLLRGYVRRDPASSQQYLRSVGLTGPFWS